LQTNPPTPKEKTKVPCYPDSCQYFHICYPKALKTETPHYSPQWYDQNLNQSYPHYGNTNASSRVYHLFGRPKVPDHNGGRRQKYDVSPRASYSPQPLHGSPS